MVQSSLFRWKLIWKSMSQSLEEEWSGTLSMLLEVQCEVSSQWWFGLPCYLLVLVHCVFWSPQSMQPSTRMSTWALHASFCWQALWRCWFHFPVGLGTCPHCQRYQKLVQWPWCYCAWLASKLAWPEPHRESMEYCQEEDERHQTQQSRWPEDRYQSNLSFHYTWAVPQADWLHATQHWCSNSCKRRPNQVLSA